MRWTCVHGREGTASSYLGWSDLIAIVHRHQVILTHGVGHMEENTGDEGGTVEQISVEAVVLCQSLLVVGTTGSLPLGPHSLQWDARCKGTMLEMDAPRAATPGPPSLGGLTCAEAGGPFLFHVGPQLPEDPFALQQLLGPTDLRWRQPNVNLGFWGGKMCCRKQDQVLEKTLVCT